MKYLPSSKNSDAEFSVISENPDETYKIGEALGHVAVPGLLMLLKGTLGMGKTCLTQGLGHALGFEKIKSPTFIIMSEYNGKVPFLHADLYRLTDNDAIESLGIEEYLEDGFAAAVEWAQLWKTPPEECRIDIEISKYGETENRLMRFTFCGEAREIFDKISEEIKTMAGAK